MKDFSKFNNKDEDCKICDIGQLFHSGINAKRAIIESKIKSENHECPLDYQQLGNCTWAFLHTTAAYYSKSPTNEEKKAMKNLVESVSLLYPCKTCATHMQKEIEIDKPDVESRVAISNWFCRFHNKVNLLLNKPEFDCENVLLRWKYGPSDASC